MEENILGFVCFGAPLFFVAMILWLDAAANSRDPAFVTGDLHKKKIMHSDIERKKEDCPSCDGPTRFRFSLHGKDEHYLFFCNRCKLHFEYIYCQRIGDFRKHIRIDAFCPECKKEHKPAIIGAIPPLIDTYQIPCEPCWDKRQVKPEPKPSETKLPPARTWSERKRRSWNPWMV